VTIVGGAGVVGSAAAYRIAQDGLATEILLIDNRQNLAEAHALDIEQAVVHRSTTQVYAGKMDDARDSDIIIISAGVPHRSVTSRTEFLADNLPILFDLVQGLIAGSPSAIWMIVSVPVDPLVYLICLSFSIPRQRVIGLNRNDSSRFRWAIAKTLSVPTTAIEAFVLGEHGDTQVPLFSQVFVQGVKVSLNPEQKSEIMEKIKGFFATWSRLQPGRTAGWNSAESIGDIIASIIKKDGRPWVCSTPLEGDYGFSGVSLGVPVRLGPIGVREIISFALDRDEAEALKISTGAVREQIRLGQELLHRR
jgi:malate dehydrogenase